MKPSASRVARRFILSTQKLYHWAPKAARASIAEYGLDHRRSRTKHDPRSQAPQGIYFHRTLADALDMGAEGLGETHDLYEVTLPPGVPLSPDPYQPEDAVYTTRAVPPSAVRRLASP